jgi:hypothetical protein
MFVSAMPAKLPSEGFAGRLDKIVRCAVAVRRSKAGAPDIGIGSE